MGLAVEIVSAEKAIWSGQAKFVVLPGSQGELGIYQGHTPLITYLKPGDVCVQDEAGESHHFYVSGGVVEVQPTGVIVLSDASQRAQDLDEAKILEAKAQAEEMLKSRKDKLEYAQIEAKLTQMMSQLQTIEKYRAQRKTT